jgi:hypothetical protein
MSEDIPRYVDDGRSSLDGVREPSPWTLRQKAAAVSLLILAAAALVLPHVSG